MDLTPIDITEDEYTGKPIYWYNMEQYFYIRNRAIEAFNRDRGPKETSTYQIVGLEKTSKTL